MDKLPDRRQIERAMATISKLLSEREFDSIEEADAAIKDLLVDGRVPQLEPTTPQERAQDLVYQAFESHGIQRINLARQALEMDPDCADAYVLLAEVTIQPEKARTLYEQAVAAAERVLGPAFFRDNAGHFWGILETRPYMRARAGLAEVMWEQGDRTAAIDTFRDLLRLNPNDNQGLRDVLLLWLLKVNDLQSVEALIDRYKDDWSAVWAYSKVLLNLLRGGNKRTAKKLIKEAVAVNPWVPVYLMGAKIPSKRLPDSYSPGDENEAILYVVDHAPLWLAAEQAITTVMFEYVLLGAKAIVDQKKSKRRWTN